MNGNSSSTGAVQQRVRHLIALANSGDSDSPEARTAAVAACRLIHQHGLLIVTTDELVTIAAPPPPAPAAAPPGDVAPTRASKQKKRRAERAERTAAPRPVAEVASEAAGEIVTGFFRDMFGGGRR